MSKFARKNIVKLKPYVPGEQPKSGQKIIKLNTNENPYPPSPKVLRKLRQIAGEQLRKYPEPLAESFRNVAARVLKVDSDMIITGNGSDEILTMIFRAFVDPGQLIAYPIPTYTLYPVLAGIQGAEIAEVPFEKDYQLPKSLLETDAKVIFIANPNAPTGTFIEPAVISSFAKQSKSLIVIDEAYADFADGNCIELVKRHNNVIVLRTFSKSYSLAGLRFGFAIANRAIIGDMLKVKDSYNCDAISIALATEAIKDRKYFQETIGKIRKERGWLTRKLRELEFTVLDSQANFVWASIKRPSASNIYTMLKQRGILLRYFDKPGLRNSLRITIGKPSENRILIRTLKDVLNKG